MKRLSLFGLVVLALARPGFAQTQPGADSAPAAEQPLPAPDVTEPPAAAPAPAVPAPEAAPAPAPAPVPSSEVGLQPSLDDLLKERPGDVTSSPEGAEARPASGHPWIEHHGYLRVRVEGFYRAHLGTNTVAGGQSVFTSAFAPPILDNAANAQGVNRGQLSARSEDWTAGANMRFRYEPTLHVTDRLAIHTQVDIFDNLLLGSTPDYNPARPDAPLALFSTSQAPPDANTSIHDAIHVKQVWMNWDILTARDLVSPTLTLSVGRMARHWGLGIVDNDGEGLDSDFGTYKDRAQLLARLWGTYFELGYDWVASGPTSTGPAQAYGEPYSLSTLSQVNEVTFAVFQKPMTEAERRARYRTLHVENRPILDWGAYLIWRWQDLDVSQASATAIQNGTIDASVPGGGYDQIQLVERHAWTLTPDVWLKMEWVPKVHQHARIELEAAAVFGHIGRVQPSDPTSGMDISSFGCALESEYGLKVWKGILSFGLDAGYASGDDSPYFGWMDHTNWADPNLKNPRLASFYFNPDYRTDLLLFRQVIGTVTDAAYFKPWAQYDFFEAEKDTLGIRLDVEYGRAIQARATPGQDANLGVETDLKVFYEQKGVFHAGIQWAMLWPLAAFDLRADYRPTPASAPAGVNITAHWATALRAIVGIMF